MEMQHCQRPKKEKQLIVQFGDSIDPNNFQRFIHDFKIHHSQPSLTHVSYYA